jgi:type I restriction enzyme S subunit
VVVDLTYIPKGWKKVNIPKVLFFQEGPGVRNWQFAETGVKLLNVGNINDGKIDLSKTSIHLSEKEAYGKYKHFLVDEGDLLIACSGIVVDNFHNKIASAEKHHLPLCLNTSTMRFKSLNDEVNLNYFKYYLQTVYFKSQLQKLITGSAQLNFGPSHIKKIDLLLPPLETQKKIVQILDNAAALRDKTKQLLREYELLSQSIFFDMFGDPVSNPMRWQINTLKKISTKILNGNTPKGGSEVYVKKGIIFLRSQNVWKNRIVYEDVAYIDQVTHDKMIKSSLKHRDILITKTGRINTENSSLGRAAMYLGDDDNANLNGHVYLVRLKTSVINEFVLHILTTKEFRGHIRRVCVGGIDKRQLNKEHIENFPIINPPINLQNQFAEIITSIEKQKELIKRELKESEDLFNCLLQKAFKGELV